MRCAGSVDSVAGVARVRSGLGDAAEEVAVAMLELTGVVLPLLKDVVQRHVARDLDCAEQGKEQHGSPAQRGDERGEHDDHEP